MSQSKTVDSPAATAQLWWVDEATGPSPASGKGLALRLAAAVPGVLPPASLILHSAQKAVSLRAARAVGRCRFDVTLKGAARRELEAGALLYPPWYEQYNATSALIAPGGHRTVAGITADCFVVPAGLPRHVSRLLQTAVRTARANDAFPFLSLERRLPLIPGCRYAAYDRHERSLGHFCVVVPLPPSSDPALTAHSAAELLAADAGRVLTHAQLVLQLFGFAGQESVGEGSAEIESVGWWQVSRPILQRCGRRLAKAAATHAGLSMRAAASQVRSEVPGSGPAFADAVVHWATRQGGLLTRRDGRYFPAGVSADSILPPAARQLRRQVEMSGRTGFDLTQSRHPNTRLLVESLERLGYAVILDNARVLSPRVLDELVEEAWARLASADAELHLQELARLWGLPRNSARAVAARLVADGRLQRTSSVHVRLPSGAGQAQ